MFEQTRTVQNGLGGKLLTHFFTKAYFSVSVDLS